MKTIFAILALTLSTGALAASPEVLRAPPGSTDAARETAGRQVVGPIVTQPYGKGTHDGLRYAYRGPNRGAIQGHQAPLGSTDRIRQGYDLQGS